MPARFEVGADLQEDQTMSRRLLLIVNLGTPDAPTPEAVHRFLLEFLSDPGVIDLPRWLWQPILRNMVLRSRPRKVAELYRSIWTEGGSPLEVGTRAIADGVEELAAGRLAVAWAYRYGERSIERAFDQHVDTDTEVAVVPLYTHHTSSTSWSVFLEAERVARARGVIDNVRRVELPPDDPGFIAAQADRCRETFAAAGGEPDHLLLSYHGIPTRYDRRERGRYSSDCRATTEALLTALDWDPQRASHCYQSKFGPEPWLKPATADRIEELADEGVKSLAVVTPGFLTDGLETIEEIGIQGAEAFEERGGERYLRVPATEAHPGLIEAIVRCSFPDLAGG
jgi:ferrochelatase